MGGGPHLAVDSFEQALAVGLGAWPQGTVFLAAVSGGADSTAMLAALEALRQEGGFLLRCLHVDHGIRPPEESRGDAEAVRTLCKTLHIPLRIVSIPQGKVAETGRRLKLGLEGAARFYRRKIWNRAARRVQAVRVLTAHTRDDVLETVLMRILRGSGPAGLSGIARSRGRVLRPLLNVSREDVLRYLDKRQIPFRTDSTNADTRYLRNRIRHKLIPCLNGLFPHWKKSLLLFTETQGLTAEFLSKTAGEQVPWDLSSPGLLRTDEGAFFSAPPILREEALLQGTDLLTLAEKKAEAGDFWPDPSPRVVRLPRRRVIRDFAAGKTSQADLGPLRFERHDGVVSLSSPNRALGGEGFSLLIKAPGVYTLKGLVFSVFPSAGQDLSINETGFFARLPLVLRSHQKDGCITAEDTTGPVVFISGGKEPRVVPCRKTENGEAGEGTLFFTVTAEKTIGGMDA